MTRWAVDTNFFPVSRSVAREELWKLHLRGAIELVATDVLGTELAPAAGELGLLLRLEAGTLHELHGPLILDHSRIDHAVLGSEQDKDLLDSVLALVKPGRLPESVGRNDFRDAMHIAWAIRYGLDGLISEDRRRMLRKADLVRDKFNGFAIMSPEQALAPARLLPAPFLPTESESA